MFAKPRPKKSLLPPPPKKRKVFAIEEISFDNSAREEYLTGFHKRKVQRQKHAQEEAAKTARAEKIEFRKQVCFDSSFCCGGWLGCSLENNADFWGRACRFETSASKRSRPM